MGRGQRTHVLWSSVRETFLYRGIEFCFFNFRDLCLRSRKLSPAKLGNNKVYIFRVVPPKPLGVKLRKKKVDAIDTWTWTCFEQTIHSILFSNLPCSLCRVLCLRLFSSPSLEFAFQFFHWHRIYYSPFCPFDTDSLVVLIGSFCVSLFVWLLLGSVKSLCYMYFSLVIFSVTACVSLFCVSFICIASVLVIKSY